MRTRDGQDVPRDDAPAASDARRPLVESDVASLTLVEIARRLEHATAQIDQERAREREARAAYRRVAEETEVRIRLIKDQVGLLLREQQKQLGSLDGVLTRAARPGVPGHEPIDSPANIGEAILRLWTLPEHDGPLSTEQIATGLPSVGYESKAAPRSLRSAVNQALAKLCRDGRVVKCRQDGTVIGPEEAGARARRYMRCQ